MSKRHIALASLVAAAALVSCDDLALEPMAPATPESLGKSLALTDMLYLSDDTYNGNPQALLGKIVAIRERGGACPRSASDNPVARFTLEPLGGFKIDEKSILGSPVKRDSQIVTRDAAASVAFLSYLSSSLDAKSVYTLILFDQASARVDDRDSTWRAAYRSWMDDHAELLQQADLCSLSVVMGFVQKNIVRRKFTEVSAAAKGGAYGVNVDGKYHTSTDDYSIDVRYGLSLGTMWQRRVTGPGPKPFGLPLPREEPTPPTPTEREVLSALTTIAHEAR